MLYLIITVKAPKGSVIRDMHAAFALKTVPLVFIKVVMSQLYSLYLQLHPQLQLH